MPIEAILCDALKGHKALLWHDHLHAGGVRVGLPQASHRGRDNRPKGGKQPARLFEGGATRIKSVASASVLQDVYEGPLASAYRRLEMLPLDDKRGSGKGDPLGELRFVEDDRPGSNMTYVEVPDFATIACLQNRLNELDENLAVEMRVW